MRYILKISPRQRLRRGLSRLQKRILDVVTEKCRLAADGNPPDFGMADLARETGATATEIDQAFVEFGIRRITSLAKDFGDELSAPEERELARGVVAGTDIRVELQPSARE